MSGNNRDTCLGEQTEFVHFIITRFNLRHSSWVEDKQGRSLLSSGWTEERMALFSRYCYPSVINQSRRDFIWLIYFDSSTELSVREWIQRLADDAPVRIISMFVNGYDEFMSSYAEDVNKLAGDTEKYVITTRLDNDDIVHRDFVRRLREHFHGQPFMAVNFVKILKVNPGNRHKIFIDYIFSNHFISLIEKPGSDGIVGCYAKKDRAWNVPGGIIQVYDKAYCVEIISDRNISNRFCGFPLLRKTDLSAFSLGEDAYRNKLADPFMLQPWKMSWRKLAIYYYLRLKRLMRPRP